MQILRDAAGSCSCCASYAPFDVGAAMSPSYTPRVSPTAGRTGRAPSSNARVLVQRRADTLSDSNGL
jgi:hypothetical protein